MRAALLLLTAALVATAAAAEAPAAASPAAAVAAAAANAAFEQRLMGWKTVAVLERPDWRDVFSATVFGWVEETAASARFDSIYDSLGGRSLSTDCRAAQQQSRAGNALPVALPCKLHLFILLSEFTFEASKRAASGQLWLSHAAAARVDAAYRYITGSLFTATSLLKMNCPVEAEVSLHCYGVLGGSGMHAAAGQPACRARPCDWHCCL